MNGQIHDVRNVLVPLVSASAGFLACYLWLTNRPLEAASTSTATPKSSQPAAEVKTEAAQGEDDSEDYSTDSDEEITPEYAQRLKNAKPPTSREECKLVLVVNQELAMTKGKIAAQCGHATLACYKTLQKTNPKLLQHWERIGQAKIAVKAQSTAELLELQRTARSLGVCAQVISDAGRTQIVAGSKTVLGIGP
ncbi:hypothetical protein FFLO_07189 [Filobasidium floriforme]|uniref:peptidyl-tRNA hydrolase n=1 Tax=Filobasidium floriforme TaxID=5210 RepID=A0A8K0NJX0_9TREE|nr:hypothetical protein FFLO_07189 [Filobasidium floriforme]